MSGRVTSTIRREALAMWPDVQVCEDFQTCVKKYDPPSKGAHDRGVTDNWGVIHLSNLDKGIYAQGMYELCVLIALRRPEIKRLPEHHRIWKSHTWAHEELQRVFRRRSRIEWTIDERIRAWRLAERAGVLMKDNISFYWWAYLGRKRAMRRGVRKARSQNRRYIPDDKIAAWQLDLKAGLSFGAMGRKYGREPRTIWKALVRRGLHQPNMV